MELARLILEYVKVLAWPLVAGSGLWIFRGELRRLVATVQHLKLPGGAEVDWQKQLRAAEMAAEKVEAKQLPAVASPERPRTDLVMKMQARGLLVSPSEYDLSYYRRLTGTDPNLALAGLRMELDRMLQNLASLYGVEYDRLRASPGRFPGLLRAQGVLEADEYDLLRSIVNVANAALHGKDVSKEDALRTIDSAEVFRDAYLARVANKLSGVKPVVSGLTGR